MTLLHTLFENQHVHIAQTLAAQDGSFDKFANTHGNSHDLYGKFNMGMHVFDDAKTVLQNRANLLNALPYAHRITWINQVHGNDVVMIDDSLSLNVPNADALIAQKTGVALAIMTADCVPIAIFDEMGADGTVACVHAGWQGLVAGIIQKTCHHLHDNKYAYIGACISVDAYEVTDELATRIIHECVDKNLVTLDDTALRQAITKPSKNPNKVMLDIVSLAKLQLLACDVTVLNEDVPCSYRDERFYSYRAQTHAKKEATGRMAMLITKKEIEG